MRGFPYGLLAFLASVGYCSSAVETGRLNQTAMDDLRIPTPPSILYPERQTTVYVSERGEAPHLRCEAKGHPEPTYEWTWNGNPIAANTSYLDMFPNNGSLIFSDFTTREDGYYQCQARNSYGLSLSQIVNVRQRVVPKFQNDGKLRSETVMEGRGVAMPCYSRPVATPPGPYNWYNVEGDRQQQIPIHVSDRLDIDVNGTLYILRTEKSDTKDSYACAALTKELDLVILARTPYMGLTVTDNDVLDMKPTLLGSTGYVTADVGGTVTLECFFDGKPKPKVTWVDDDLKRIRNGTQNRFYMSTSAHKLVISHVTDDDEGTYTCTASNHMGSDKSEVKLNVTSRPLFQTDSPKDIIAPVGSDATFSCLARGAFSEQLSPPQWFINGEPVPTNVSKFSLNEEGTEMTVVNVTKDDIMNVQCNVSNSRGYAFGDGYLTVIDPLEITERPDDQIEVEVNSTWVNLTIKATSDRCCPVRFTWTLNGEDLTRTALHRPPYSYSLGHNTATLIVRVDGEEEQVQRVMGEYQCQVWHQVYSETRTATVTLKMKAVDDEEPTPQPIQAAQNNWWWIGLAGGLLVLLIAVVLIVLMIRFNYPRQEYLLEKEEKKHKLNPEQDLLDQSFEEI